MRRIWEERFTPSVFDLDVRGEVAPVALCRFFGVAAVHHAMELGVGDEILRARGQAWMLRRLEARFAGVAAGEQPLVVRTWPSDRTGRLRAERDFTIEDGAGRVVAAGLSTWLLIQLATRRPARMPQEVLDFAVKGKAAPVEPLSSVETGKLAAVRQWTAPVAWTDLDINGHATFVRLVEWTLGAAPPPQWTRNRLAGMVLQFEQEALPGDRVTAWYEAGGEMGAHALTKGDGVVAVRGWTQWRPL